VPTNWREDLRHSPPAWSPKFKRSNSLSNDYSIDNRSLERHLSVAPSDYKWRGVDPSSSPLRITCAGLRYLPCLLFISLPRFPTVSTGNPTWMPLLPTSARPTECLLYLLELTFDTEPFLNLSQRPESLPNHVEPNRPTPSLKTPRFRIYLPLMLLRTHGRHLPRMRVMHLFL